MKHLHSNPEHRLNITSLTFVSLDQAWWHRYLRNGRQSRRQPSSSPEVACATQISSSQPFHTAQLMLLVPFAGQYHLPQSHCRPLHCFPVRPELAILAVSRHPWNQLSFELLGKNYIFYCFLFRMQRHQQIIYFMYDLVPVGLGIFRDVVTTFVLLWRHPAAAFCFAQNRISPNVGHCHFSKT